MSRSFRIGAIDASKSCRIGEGHDHCSARPATRPQQQGVAGARPDAGLPFPRFDILSIHVRPGLEMRMAHVKILSLTPAIPSLEQPSSRVMLSATSKPLKCLPSHEKMAGRIDVGVGRTVVVDLERVSREVAIDLHIHTEPLQSIRRLLGEEVMGQRVDRACFNQWPPPASASPG